MFYISFTLVKRKVDFILKFVGCNINNPGEKQLCQCDGCLKAITIQYHVITVAAHESLGEIRW